MFNCNVGDEVRMPWSDQWYVVMAVEDGSVKIRLKSQSVGGVWADKHKIVEWINGKPEPAHFSAPAPVVSSIVTSFQEPAEPCDEEEENPCIADLGNEEAEPGDGSRWEEL